MPIRDETETYDYRYPDGSVWTFRRHKLRPDTEAISERAFAFNTEFDAEAARLARKSGRDYVPHVEQITKMSSFLAEMEYMSEGWSGPEFTLPAGYRDKTGPKGIDGLHPLHPLAGKLAPCTAEWIGRCDSAEDVYSHMQKVWAVGSDFRDRSGADAGAPQPTPDAGADADAPAADRR